MTIKDLGRILFTKSVSILQTENASFSSFVGDCLTRYTNHDWGDLCEEDRQMNEQALKSNEDRIFASYAFPSDASWVAVNGYGGRETKIWIITEWDHSATTILFPGEY